MKLDANGSSDELVTVDQRGWSGQTFTSEERTVLAAKVFNRGIGAGDANLQMLSGYRVGRNPDRHAGFLPDDVSSLSEAGLPAAPGEHARWGAASGERASIGLLGRGGAERVAEAMHCPDEARLARVVTERVPDLRNQVDEIGVDDERARPENFVKLRLTECARALFTRNSRSWRAFGESGTGSIPLSSSRVSESTTNEPKRTRMGPRGYQTSGRAGRRRNHLLGVALKRRSNAASARSGSTMGAVSSTVSQPKNQAPRPATCDRSTDASTFKALSSASYRASVVLQRHRVTRPEHDHTAVRLRRHDRSEHGRISTLYWIR